MTRDEVEIAVAAAIDAESKTGASWWPGSEMAPIAVRRWFSFSRRRKTKRPTNDDRVLDLAKGLQARFEPDALYTHFGEWMHLATVVAAILPNDLSPEGTAFL